MSIRIIGQFAISVCLQHDLGNSSRFTLQVWMNISHTAIIQSAVGNTYNLPLAAQSSRSNNIFHQQGVRPDDVSGAVIGPGGINKKLT